MKQSQYFGLLFNIWMIGTCISKNTTLAILALVYFIIGLTFLFIEEFNPSSQK